jgi:hypothetical protein
MRSPTGVFMQRRSGICLSLGALASILVGCEREAQVLSPEVRAAVPTSALVSATDPAGDAAASHGNGLTGEPYQDIIGATIDFDQATFTFSMDVGTSVPGSPVLPGGITVQEWSWNINTAPELPSGFPFAPGGAAPPEFIVMVTWNGSTFAGILIDRRPLLSGGQAVSTSIPFEIDGATITADVSASRLGNPTSFALVARTNNWPHFGSGSVQTLDRAPDIAPIFWQ